LEILLLISVFIIATCGLIYELIAGTLASYLLGDSVTQFSTIIGCYLFAMGIGSWLSRYITRNLLGFFIHVEILVGLVGGSSAALLFLGFEHIQHFRLLLYTTVAIIGILVGIEIPVLLRILQDRFEFRDLVSRVFTFDYIGALFASLLFPLILVPQLGLLRTAFLFGILNTLVAVWAMYAIPQEFKPHPLQKMAAFAVLSLLIAGFAFAEPMMGLADASHYPGKVVLAKTTPYQRIVVTRQAQDLRLYLNANLQFSSMDEYRYHEALVHPILSAIAKPRHVLIIGGGDGLALREILRYPSIQSVTLVDLDPEMTRLFRSNPMLSSLNSRSLEHPSVTVLNQDAYRWLRDQQSNLNARRYDAIVIDLPDPSNFSVGKLYSVSFFKLLHHVLAPEGLAVIQSTSPLIARQSFWCVNHTLEAAAWVPTPYHAYVPSFGEWGFIIAGRTPYHPPTNFPTGLRFLSADTLQQMLHFPPDMSSVDTRIQRLDDQALIHYFDQEWSRYIIYN